MNNLVKMTRSAYTTAKNTLTLVCPNVAYISDEDKVEFLRVNPEVGVGIKAVGGLCYTLEEWNALETKPTAVGVYVRHANGGFVIHGTQNTSVKWSSDQSVQIAGVTTTNNQTTALLDMAGWDNTQAVLAAKTAGDIADCPLFDWARGLSFADSSQGYVPSMGELNMIKENLASVNLCRAALSQTEIVFSGRNIWTSTQYSASHSWFWFSSYWYNYTKGNNYYGVAVCAL